MIYILRILLIPGFLKLNPTILNLKYTLQKQAYAHAHTLGPMSCRHHSLSAINFKILKFYFMTSEMLLDVEPIVVR